MKNLKFIDKGVLDAFTKFRKASISFALFVHPSVLLRETALQPLDGFS